MERALVNGEGFPYEEGTVPGGSGGAAARCAGLEWAARFYMPRLGSRMSSWKHMFWRASNKIPERDLSRPSRDHPRRQAGVNGVLSKRESPIAEEAWR